MNQNHTSVKVSLTQESGSRFNSEVAYACGMSSFSVSGQRPLLILSVHCKVPASGCFLTMLPFLLHAICNIFQEIDSKHCPDENLGTFALGTTFLINRFTQV